MNDKFCVLPFSHLNVTARGHILPCCNFDWKQDLVIDNLHSTDLKSIFESKKWYKLRKSLKTDTPSSGCHKCFSKEVSDAKSLRQASNDIYGTSDELSIKSLELKLGSKCNLACRTCSHHSSNKLLKEDSLFNTGRVDKEWMADIQKQSSFIHDDIFWKQIYKISENLELVKFTGGEPLLIHEHYAYLHWLKDNNIFPKLAYITNGTIGPDDEKLELWSHFPAYNIDASIDAVGELSEYVRTGSVWNDVKQNILDFNTKTPDFAINATFSIYNIIGIRQLVEFIEENNIRWGCNTVFEPDWQAVFNLPDNAKKFIKDELNNLINTDVSQMSKDNIQNIINHVNMDRTTDRKFSYFCERKEHFYEKANGKPHTNTYEQLEPEWFNIIKEGEKC